MKTISIVFLSLVCITTLAQNSKSDTLKLYNAYCEAGNPHEIDTTIFGYEQDTLYVRNIHNGICSSDFYRAVIQIKNDTLHIDLINVYDGADCTGDCSMGYTIKIPQTSFDTLNLKIQNEIITVKKSDIISGQQEFAPIGAEWYYTEGFVIPEIDYLRIQSVKDTVIKGKSCKQLDCDRLCWNPSNTQFIYYSNDSLFHFNSDLDTFQLISYFNAAKGDSWDILSKDFDESIDTVTVTVDSVSSVWINENRLRQLHVTYHVKNYNAKGAEIHKFSYPSRIIEKIGDVNYLFNFPEHAGSICDDNYSKGLRCYEDPDFGFYSTGIADSCTYSTKKTRVDKKRKDLNFVIHPNPASNRIKIKTTVHSEITIKIYEFSGHLVLKETITGSTELNVSMLSPGIYFVQLTDSEKILGWSKMIKN